MKGERGEREERERRKSREEREKRKEREEGKERGEREKERGERREREREVAVTAATAVTLTNEVLGGLYVALCLLPKSVLVINEGSWARLELSCCWWLFQLWSHDSVITFMWCLL